jgi:hypothetical protein
VSIVDLFVPADRMQALTHVRLGVYGPNGAGKTTFASTMPNTERVLYVSVDDENLRPISTLKHYRALKIRDWSHIWVIYDWLRAQAGRGTVTTLVWDTWSRVQDLAVGQVCNYHPSDPARLSKYVDSIPKNPHDWRGWGQVGALCSEWQRNFNMLPVNIVYLMQEQDRRSEQEGQTRTGPRLTPEALKGIRDSLEVLGRLYVDLAPGDPTQLPEEGMPPALDLLDPGDRIDPNAREIRRLFIGQHDRYIAKGPTHILGRVVTNPTWDTVVAPIMRGEPVGQRSNGQAAG